MMIGMACGDAETPPGTLVPITLKAILTEIGTLQLWCLEKNGDHRWKLEYELRSAKQEGLSQGAQD